MDALLDHGIPAIAFQPSASTRTRKQQLMYFETFALKEVLKHNLVPVVHGDVSVDAVQGMNIVSTEQLFDNLARELNPNRILLASNVDGVYAGGPKMDSDVDFFDYIDPSNWAEVETHLDGSQSADVTGGMYTKVRDMYHLTLAMPPMQAMIFSGERPENVKEVLLGRTVDFGTLIN